MLRFLIIVLLLAGCSRDSEISLESETGETEDPIELVSHRLTVEVPETKSDSVSFLIDANETAVAQRQQAWRLLVGDGLAADPDAAIQLAARAAVGGDSVAMLWTGRAALHPPGDRTEAAAWFLLAQRGRDAGTREDAKGEYEALKLSQQELDSALVRVEELLEKITQSAGDSLVDNR